MPSCASTVCEFEAITSFVRLVGAALVEVDLLVERALADRDRVRARARDRRDELGDRLVELLRGDDAVDQAPLERGLRVDRLAGQQQLERVLAADGA